MVALPPGRRGRRIHSRSAHPHLQGWLKARAANGTIISDPVKFPEGMAALGQYLHAQSFAPGRHLRYGLYTSRGTCQCSTPWYSGPGSQGYEVGWRGVAWRALPIAGGSTCRHPPAHKPQVQDAQYFADAGADYVKEDSCCGSQVPSVAFADYARMRDALNATGRPIYFALCGWEDWYAPVGASLGCVRLVGLAADVRRRRANLAAPPAHCRRSNSWRISGDGSGWGPLTVAVNKMAYIWQYAGPGVRGCVLVRVTSGESRHIRCTS